MALAGAPALVLLALLLPLQDAAHQHPRTGRAPLLHRGSQASNHSAAQLSSTSTNRSTTSTHHEEQFPRVFIGILSAPTHFERREKVRETWLNALKDSKEARAGRVVAKFMIGRSSAIAGREGHLQGELASHDEKGVEEHLTKESRTNKDIYRLPHMETYQNLPSKVLLILKRGLDANADFVVKIDDDQRLHFDKMLPILTAKNARSYMYGGNYLWDQQLYKSQIGADGSFHKYFAGPGYILSAPLARKISETHLSHSVAYDLYGSSSEDVDMGFWVGFENKRLQRRENKSVVYRTFALSAGF